MALKSARLVFSKGVSKTIGGILIDAFVQENHQYKSNVTEYPIESGGIITDHIVNRPFVLQVQAIQGIAKIGQSSAVGNRVLDTFDTLTQLRENKLPATVVTGLKVYENMFITDLNISRTANNGQSLPLQMTLTQINIVQSQTAIIPKSQLTGDTASQQQAQQEQDVGDTQSGQTQVTETDNFLDQIEADVDALFAGLGL